MPRADKLIPNAKISDDAVRRVVQGFARLETVADIAAATGVSAKTVRKLVLALRPVLLAEPFDAWRDASTERMLLDSGREEIARKVVFGYLADSYFNRTCYMNHQQGRRASRLCRACSIRALDLPPDFVEAALYQIDLVHAVYAALGIGAEREADQARVFRLRLVHLQTVGTAHEASGWDGEGALKIESAERLGVGILEQAILANISRIELRSGV